MSFSLKNLIATFTLASVGFSSLAGADTKTVVGIGQGHYGIKDSKSPEVVSAISAEKAESAAKVDAIQRCASRVKIIGNFSENQTTEGDQIITTASGFFECLDSTAAN